MISCCIYLAPCDGIDTSADNKKASAESRQSGRRSGFEVKKFRQDGSKSRTACGYSKHVES